MNQDIEDAERQIERDDRDDQRLHRQEDSAVPDPDEEDIDDGDLQEDDGEGGGEA